MQIVTCIRLFAHAANVVMWMLNVEYSSLIVNSECVGRSRWWPCWCLNLIWTSCCELPVGTLVLRGWSWSAWNDDAKVAIFRNSLD